MSRLKKHTVGKIYPKYQPYPLSFDSDGLPYSSETRDSSLHPSKSLREAGASEKFHDLIDDPTPDWLPSRPAPSIDKTGLRPLRLLQSLFTDRLNFVQRAIDELEYSKKERERLIGHALDELDSEIQECEVTLPTLQDVLNHSERKREIQRRLFELKRERRRETLMSWRDVMWLKAEIRKLQREIDAISKTGGSIENRHHPT